MDAKKQHKDQASCPKCGSLHSHRAEFRRYRGEMTSSAPGGDLSAISPSLTARICICGHPDPDIPRLSIPPEERRCFRESVTAALTYREQSHPRTIAERLRQTFAVREELEALTNRLQYLEEIISTARRERIRG